MNELEASGSCEYSFVIPAYNEEETLFTLCEEISESASKFEIGEYEIIFVDDGSSDQTWNRIQALEKEHPRVVKGLRMRTNAGKANALAVGFRHAMGKFIFTLDADLQDNPSEMSKFIEKMNEGYDVVSGWKFDRKDPIDKTLPSKVFNSLTSLLSGIKIHDMNCGFKLYKREVIESIDLYGELHRFIPILANSVGFSVSEVKVEHRPRTHGVSKYGYKRFIRGSIDLMSVLTTTRYIARPAHLFGSIGGILGLLGFGVLSYLSILWCIGAGPIGNRPLFFLGILCVISSVQLISFGLLAELMTKQSNRPFVSALIRESVGIEKEKKV
ncbi:glycosyltransferase family 2 protein [Pelagicoccus mobilis]|uniref:Glycosyltransferase family 2 protein n=1 Tax=Pelagicoccus mobilis TaxID=415221 RepID=A0A934RQM1_9BACT|nr:glycosyltransferase family 2 protein [Pelagicoccus mobilis]MBK1875740.1 glycosyltransferase family 2 protein [Pelagicoccus mobilis]